MKIFVILACESRYDFQIEILIPQYMYSYGQFCKTPIGRMRVRKASSPKVCTECEFGRINCWTNAELFDFCLYKLPEDAYLEKPSVGGKDHTSN